MEGEETFSTIAEVAIAYLGFTGLIGVFSGRTFRPAVLLRLWVMVELGLGLLLLALLPLVLHYLGWDGARLWILCSAAGALLFLAHVAFVVPRIVPHIRSGDWYVQSSFLNVSFPVLMLGFLATQVLHVLGVGFERGPGSFLLGLYLLLAASGSNFITLLVDLLAREEPK